MFIENKIIFGHGTIGVSADTTFQALIIEYLKPPSPVGDKVTKDQYESKTKHGRRVFIYKPDMKELLADLEGVSAENPVIEFRGYLFDFTEFKPESVRVVKYMLSKAIAGNPLTWA